MKINIRSLRTLYALAAGMLILYSCKKSNDASSDTTTTDSEIGVAAAFPITAAADSVYFQQDCGRGGSRDSVAQADLPTAVTDYLTANYAGYVYHKAFSVKDSTGAVTGYAVVIYADSKPVGLLFDAEGTFVKVLEQRRGKGKRH
jgi:hypothetical protein